MVRPAGHQDRAVVDGDELVLDGEKIFITNGFMADLVIVAAQVVNPATGGEPKLSLVLVEASRDGFTKEKPLNKLGQKRRTPVPELLRCPRSQIKPSWRRKRHRQRIDDAVW